MEGEYLLTSYKPLSHRSEEAQKLAQEILTANYDRRRQIYESLDLMRFQNRKIEVNLSYLLQNPTAIDDDAFNYAVLWALRNKDIVNLESVKKALSTDKFTSEYAKKMAVALALSLGDKNGVSIVLDTLQYETLDTGYNYGDNIYKQLSNYLGVDFGLDKQAWINWWNEVKGNFQLPRRES